MRQWDNAKSDCTTQVNLFVEARKRDKGTPYATQE